MIGSLILDRYRIDSEVGEGGIGMVYLALESLLEREAALKLLSGKGLSVDGQTRLLVEARAAAAEKIF